MKKNYWNPNINWLNKQKQHKNLIKKLQNYRKSV